MMLRLFGVAGGSSYTPPRLIQIVEEGQLKGEIVQSSQAPFFVEASAGMMETNTVYHQGLGSGFPHSGSMRKVRFSKEPSLERYFLLGGSAALGQQPVNLKTKMTWKTIPLGNSVAALPIDLSISGEIQSRLLGKGISAEVLNAGMIAQDSGGVRRLAMEVLQYNPTGLFLYLGNNEGIGMAYGMNGVTLEHVPEVREILRSIRLYRVLADAIVPQTAKPPNVTLSGTKPEVLGRLTQNQWRAAGRALVQRGMPTDSVYKALLKRLQTNLAQIKEACQAQGVSLYIITTPPHLTYPPFYSANSPELLERDIYRYSKLLGNSNQAQRKQDWSSALQYSQQAVSIEKNHANGWFVYGESLRRNRQEPAALEAFETALWMDLSRKRTLPSYANIAAEVCKDGGCQTVSAYDDLRLSIEKKGFSILDQRFGDHEHLTPQGCRWIAGLFMKLLDTNKEN
ncbi:MAG: hypothetical protein VX278_14445 [Myxococcota bacterium]|nr:hypothetical protein [Myxococcota bacterium]